MEIRVLVIEPDMSIARRIEACLTGAGMIVETTDTSEDGLMLAKANKYRVVLLSTAVGTTWKETLQELSGEMSARVVVLAKDRRDANAATLPSYGAVGTVTYPIDYGLLDNLVHNAATRGR
jgi:DNA-binding NtrC family response regulator